MSTSNKKKATVAVLVVLAWGMLAAFGCTPKEGEGSVRSDGTDSNQSAATAAWSAEADCATCHIAEADSAIDASTLYSTHSVHENMSECIDCHADTDEVLTGAHKNYQGEKAKVPAKLKKSDVSEAVCTTSGCHSIDELVATTADYTELAGSNGKIVNPHTMISDEFHKVDGSNGADIQCSSCHKMHETGGIEDRAVLETASKKCAACHHSGVFECNTCH